jgi:hypothetical protein
MPILSQAVFSRKHIHLDPFTPIQTRTVSLPQGAATGGGETIGNYSPTVFSIASAVFEIRVYPVG